VAEEPERIGVLAAAAESLAGDVYAEPSAWRPLTLGTFFSEGWDQAWASPPNGPGGAPRHGWLNTFDGVFYRLAIGTFAYSHGPDGVAERYSGTLTAYLPLSRRFELRADLPVTSSVGAAGRRAVTNGDQTYAARFLLSETQTVTQSFNLYFRTPTGELDYGNGVAAVTPQYEFWANPWRGVVARGGVGAVAPFGHQSIREANARTTFLGDLGLGYYFTPHEMAPFGDLVVHVTTNLSYYMDDRGPNTTTVSFFPGFRNHIGHNVFVLAGVDVPATDPAPYDYQLQTGLMYVF